MTRFVSTPPLLEIAANSFASALAAQDGGADRVELCASLADGGVTPSYGMTAATRDALHIPLHVLIRPRAGDFLYDDAELDIMRRDIETCVRLGCDGVVLGALDIDGHVDVRACRALIDAAGPLCVSFHRAFDAVRDPLRALDEIIALRCARVLTSGAAADAISGAAAIAAYVAHAAARIRIMAGAGIRTDNLAVLIKASRADEFHASAKSLRRSPMRWRNDAVHGLDADYEESDVERIRELVNILHSAQE